MRDAQTSFLPPGEGFLGLPDGLDDPGRAQAVVLPVPYEQTVSYGGGTAAGPEAILRASHQVELYDEELDAEVVRLWDGVATAAPLDLSGLHGERAVQRIQQAAAALAAEGRFVLGLGGEHTVTAGLVAAQAERHPGLSVLQIDAHSDLRDTYEGDRWSHACVMARVRDLGVAACAVGIRSQCAEEAARMREEGLPVWYGHDLRRRAAGGDLTWIEEVVDSLGDPVYLTVDVDGLDPSVIPATGTPEPGGLLWHEVTALLRAVGRRRRIVAADVVELAPAQGLHHADFAAARLAHKILGLRASGPMA
jgi:agmatinase